MTTVFPDDEDVSRKNDIILASMEKQVAEHSKPNYYAILPAAVRYDENISWMEKILYAEITALSSKEGYCYATNAYFARNYKVSTRTVSRAITNLTEKGFLFTLLENYGTNTLRKIYITSNAEKLIPQVVAHSRGVDKTVLALGKKGEGVDKSVVPPLDKNVAHNNTSNNSINTNTLHIPATQDGVDDGILPPWLGKNGVERLGKLYELLWQAEMGVKHTLKIIGKNGSILKGILAGRNEVLAALILVTHFDWRGMSGKDEKQFNVLRDNGFPLGWIPTRVDMYQAFLQGTLGIRDAKQQGVAINQVLKKLSKD